MTSILSNSQTVSLTDFSPEYPVLEVLNAHCSAKIALHGAHVFEWTPTGHYPVIYTSPDAIFREGKAIRGGIPICWPWFNAHPTDSTKPSHGIARNRFWELSKIQETAENTIVTLKLQSNEETKTLWNYDFLAEVMITLGKNLSVSLKTMNTGSEPFVVGGALHTYLYVQGISKTLVSGLDGQSYIDTVGTEAIRKQEGEITITEEIDRIYEGFVGDILVKDPKRILKVSRSGSNSAVVWNPWIEKAKGLGDLPDDAYQDFICVEAANARDDVYSLKKGESHTLSTTVAVLDSKSAN